MKQTTVREIQAMRKRYNELRLNPRVFERLTNKQAITRVAEEFFCSEETARQKILGIGHYATAKG